MAFWCGDNHLPDVGGVLDQDYVSFRWMMATKNAYDALVSAKRYKGKEIHNMPYGISKTIAYLQREGLM